MTEAQIKYLVDRFLCWKLPANFNPDNGISFNPVAGDDGPFPFKREPSGTNLLDASQADAMVRHMIEGMPERPSAEDRARSAYDTFRGGFHDTPCPAPEWDAAPTWVRDVVNVAYLQGKLDRA